MALGDPTEQEALLAAIKIGQEEERIKIMDIIKDRLTIHEGFINGALDHGVEPSPSIYSAMVELRSLLRELEK